MEEVNYFWARGKHTHTERHAPLFQFFSFLSQNNTLVSISNILVLVESVSTEEG